MVDDTLDVTAVTAVPMGSVGILRGIIGGVVRRVAVCETVRHDEVDHVRSSEASAFSRTCLTRRDFIRILERLAVLREHDVICAGLCVRSDLHVHEKIVRAVRLIHLLYRNALAAFDGYIIL